MKELLNKQEERDLKKRGYKLSKKKPNGLVVRSLIVMSHGNRELHDSGYPFIKIFGVIEGNKLVFLGWHDHWISYVPTNTDSFGKNIFHIMPWLTKKQWKVKHNFMSLSTFQIGDYMDEGGDYVMLK